MSIFGKQSTELKKKDCKICEGTGYVTCPKCDGKGKLYPYNSPLSTCNECKGTGKIRCVDCHGFGWIRID